MEREPFIIRAHHLIKVNHYFKEATKDLLALEKLVEARTALKGNLDHGIDASEIEYNYDLLGENPSEYLPVYRQKVMDYFSRFAKLSNDYPIHITDQKDGLCLACKVGRHCDEGTENPSGKVIGGSEQNSMLHFLEQAKSIGLKENEDYTIIGETNSGIVRIETDKKVVISMLG